MSFEEDAKENFLWREKNAEYIELAVGILISRIHGGDKKKWHLRNETEKRSPLDTIHARKSHWKNGFDATVEYSGDRKDLSDRRPIYAVELKSRSTDFSFYKYKDVLLELVSQFQPLPSTNPYDKPCSDPCYSFKPANDTWGWFFTSKADYIVYYFEENDLWIMFSMDEMRDFVLSNKFLNMPGADLEDNAIREIIYNKWRTLDHTAVLSTYKERNNGYLTLNGFASHLALACLKSYRGIVVKNRNDYSFGYDTLELPLQKN